MKTILAFALLWCAVLRAEELLPELASLSQGHRLQSSALDEQKRQVVTNAQNAYLNALNAADQAATAAGNVTTLAAIAKERQLVGKGGMGETHPADLPKTLGPARKAFLRALERAEATVGGTQKQVDAEYLRALAGLQQSAARNPKLAEQIAAEKVRVLSGVRGPLTDVTKGLDGTRWRKITPGAKGQEEWHFSGGKLNRTWVYETESPDKIRIFWNEKRGALVTLGKDGKTLLERGKPVWELLTPPAGQ